MTFTVADLENALDVEKSEVTVPRYYLNDEYLGESWADADGGSLSVWSAKKDENGRPVIMKMVTVSVDDDDYDELIDEVRDNLSDFYYQGGHVPGIGDFEVVDQGNLGDGHEAWCLLKHVESGRLFRKDGYYSSWDAGTVLDGDLVEVVEAEVKVVRYRPISGGKPFDYPAMNVSS